MDRCHLLCLACLLLTAELVSSAAGPVFINPDVATPVVNPTTNQGNYVTQTVYGFLDFTTTIGNTVMVFSPQSAALPEPIKEVKETVSNIIETKPLPETKNQETIIIKPSKTEANPEKNKASERAISSVVQVQSSPPLILSSKVEVKTASSQVNVIEAKPSKIISSKVEVVAEEKPAKKNVNVVLSSKVEVVSEAPKVTVIATSSATPPVASSVVNLKVEDEPAVIIGNNIGEPEYDFLSRQPSEVVEETYKVINLKPSSKFHLKPRPSADAKNKGASKRADSVHPTGLVTKLGGTVVKDGVTTVHETSVIGTYISGKYAQVLQSTSHIHHNSNNKAKISPSPTLRILKTAAPALGKNNKHHRLHLEPTPTGSINEETALPGEHPPQNSIKSTRKPTSSGSSFKPRFKNRQKETAPEVEEDSSEQDIVQHPSYKKSQRNRTQNRNSKQNTSHRPHKFGRSGRKKSSTTTESVHSEETTQSTTSGKRYQSRRNKQRNNNNNSQEITSSNSSNGFSRRAYKPKVQASTVQEVTASTSLYKFKLNRSPGRWQYKTTPKPRVTIRKQTEDEEGNETPSPTPATSPDTAVNDVVTPQARSDDVERLEGSESIASIIDDRSSTENKIDTPAFPLETLKVEISTPPDFKDVYYEIATIKSPYTFQVGNVKNTRYITVTSTFEKSLVNTAEASLSASSSEPLTENILATSSNYEKDNNFLDSSVATLPPIYLASDMETPPLETLTETFSTTQTMLKTHILPVVRSGANETATSTLVQTYLVTRLVTATKTLPPMDAYHFIPSKTLKEFNSHLDEAGSELHLELEFGDQNEQDEDGNLRKSFPPDLDLANIGSDFDLSDVDKSRLPEGHLRLKKAHAPSAPKPAISEALPTPGLNPDQLQQLALLRLLNPAAAQNQVITTSRPVIKVETVYESHVIPITNGQATLLSTISKVLGTVTKTDYEFGTSTIAPALPVPPVPVNPLFPAVQPQLVVTSSPVVQSTLVTQTDSKILKLTFGAKTAYTTIFSTKVVPTLLTTYMTASVQVQPTAAFPGFFPAPFPGYPFVG